VIRAVLDTNVVVSSFLGLGSIPDQIIEAWRSQKFELCLSDLLYEEIRDVLRRPQIRKRIKAAVEDVALFLEQLPANSYICDQPLLIEPVVKEDPDDDVVLATAIAASADLIVSGDRHLLALTTHGRIPIVSPREFLLILREREREE